MASETAIVAVAETSKDRDMDIEIFYLLVFMVLIPCMVKSMLFSDALKVTHHMQFS